MIDLSPTFSSHLRLRPTQPAHRYELPLTQIHFGSESRQRRLNKIAFWMLPIALLSKEVSKDYATGWYSAVLQSRLDGGHPNPVSNKKGWNPTTKVLASSSQKYESWGGVYIEALMNELNQPEVHSLEEAHKILTEKGYQVRNSPFLIDNFSLYPVQTPGTLNIWQKNDTAPQRYVLFLENSDDFLKAETDFMKESLTSIYQVPEDHMKRFTDPSQKDFEEGLQWLASQVKAHDNKGVEFLILGHLHGRTTRLLPDFSTPEGEAEGGLKIGAFGMGETDIRRLIQQYIPETPLLILLDSCYSGAFIAKASDKAGLNTVA